MPSAEDVRDAVLKLHRPWRIYDKCRHHIDYDDETGDPLPNQHEGNEPICVEEIGWTCADGLLYIVCQECCCDDVYQREDCIDHHDHSHDASRRCETVHQLTALFASPAPQP